MKSLSKALLSLLLIGTSAVSIGVDWNDSHVFHPDWHQHARFHDIVLLAFLCGMSLVSLWLLWRRSQEEFIAIVVSVSVVVCFWGSFFIAAAVPGSSPAAHVDESPPSLAGVPLYTNMIIATFAIVFSMIACAMYKMGIGRKAATDNA